MTYSRVALDESTGELGVAVQSRWPAVGSEVPWLQPGVGAVAAPGLRQGPRRRRLLRRGIPTRLFSAPTGGWSSWVQAGFRLA